MYPSIKARQPNTRAMAAANTPHADVIHITSTNATNYTNKNSRTIKILHYIFYDLMFF